MGSSRSLLRAREGSSAGSRQLAVWLALVLAGSCTLAPAKVWNLEQLHEPDGTPRRRGQLMGELEFVLQNISRDTNFGGAEFQAERAEGQRIDDPFGECFANVLALARSQRDERVAALQVSAFAWLAVDCTYVLSRERCALELGDLARDLGVAEAGAPPAGEPASPTSVREGFEALLAAVRGVEAAPGLAGDSLAEACARIRALPLERAGALRLLRASNRLLEPNESDPAYAPLRGLRLELAQRCTVMALRAALEDAHGLVRAAALEAALRAFPAERAELLRRAIVEPMEGVEARDEVSLRALQLLARHGLPSAAGADAEAELEHEFQGVLVQVLRLSLSGPHDAAACQALAKITRQAPTLRPERWFAYWRAERARAATPAVPESATPLQADPLQQTPVPENQAPDEGASG